LEFVRNDKQRQTKTGPPLGPRLGSKTGPGYLVNQRVTSMGNGKISVILGTLNEEDQIRECLDSVKDIADEIIIADSVGSF